MCAGFRGGFKDDFGRGPSDGAQDRFQDYGPSLVASVFRYDPQPGQDQLTQPAGHRLSDSPAPACAHTSPGGTVVLASVQKRAKGVAGGGHLPSLIGTWTFPPPALPHLQGPAPNNSMALLTG